ncbi:MAG: hypothetical protein U0232_08135 [Thermomicrobiales bacterium]
MARRWPARRRWSGALSLIMLPLIRLFIYKHTGHYDGAPPLRWSASWE